MNQYEAMFLFDPTFGSSFEKCEAEVRRLMDRAKAQIILCRKWDERRLAYRIQGRKRGVYVLVYFKASPQDIVPLERDVKLSETILRVLVLRADGLTPEAMEEAFRTRGDARPKAAAREDKAAESVVQVDKAAVTDAVPAGESQPVTAKATVADGLDDDVTTE